MNFSNGIYIDVLYVYESFTDLLVTLCEEFWGALSAILFTIKSPISSVAFRFLFLKSLQRISY